LWRRRARIAEGGEDNAGCLGQGHAIVDPAHRQNAHRTTGSVYQFDNTRQHLLNAVSEDRLGVAATHLQDLQWPMPADVDLRNQPLVQLERMAAAPA
jgi:hypothetical protein